MLKRREGRESGANSGREQLVYTLSLEKLWLSFDIDLKSEIEQHTPNSLDMDHNISFSHPHLIVANRWEKLKHIKKALQPIEFRIFTIVEREYINEKLEHSFLKVWRYWHAKRSGRLMERTTKKEAKIEELICHLGLDYFFIGVI